MKRRPLVLPACVAVTLLPGCWLAARLVSDRAGIEALCRAATWYDPARCAMNAIVVRGALVLGVMCLLAATVAWLLMHRRDALIASEGQLFLAIRSEWRAIPIAHGVAIVALVLIALVIRIPLLSLPMRSDENQTLLLYSGRSLEAALWQFDTTNNHILFSVLSRVPVALFGSAPWSARFIELVTGVLLVPATALALRRLHGPSPALLGAAMIAGLPYLAAFSSNARGYSLVALLVVAAVPFALRLSARADITEWTVFAMLTALALLTNPTAVYPFGALGCWVLVRRVLGADRRVADVFAGAVFIGLASWVMYGPALAAMGTQALFANPWMKPPTWAEFSGTFVVTFDGTLRELWWQWGWGLPVWVTTGVLIAMVLGLATDMRKAHRGAGLLMMLVIWTALVAAASHRLPYTRVLLPYLPLFLVAAAGVIITILRRAGLPTRTDARFSAIGAVAIALALSLAHEAARTVYMTRARAPTAHESLVSSSHARSHIVGDRPVAHGARAHAGSGTARGNAEHA